MKSNNNYLRQIQVNYINKKVLPNRMKYSTKNHLRLQKAISKECYQTVPNWDNDIYTAWLRYLNGEDRETIIKGTRFSNFSSLKYQFRKHPCQKDIAKIRKTFKKVKTRVNVPITNYPWLLGLYYADGCIRNKSQLSFGLSLHEKLIVDRVFKELKEILGKNALITRELIGNMRQIRTSSVEICNQFPKKDKEHFFNLWKRFTQKQKLDFIAGFIDGDGCCAFDVGINSIQVYSKDFLFILKEFKNLLSEYGYVSLNNNILYLSSNIGLKLKSFLVKKDIKRSYQGSVDVKKALNLLKNGISIYKISKMMGFSKKTVHLALKQVYGIKGIKKYTDKTKLKRNPKYFNNQLEKYYNQLKNKSLYQIAKENKIEHTHLKNLLIKRYGINKIKKYIQKNMLRSRIWF